jgi:hypothetical protein
LQEQSLPCNDALFYLPASCDHLKQESKRIVSESKELLADARRKRRDVSARILTMKSSEIEAVIAEAYNGRMLAEAQLYTTSRSREDTLRAYLA